MNIRQNIKLLLDEKEFHESELQRIEYTIKALRNRCDCDDHSTRKVQGKEYLRIECNNCFRVWFQEIPKVESSKKSV